MSKFELGTVQNNLSQLVQSFGEVGTVAIYKDLAGRLSLVAHQEPAWSWRYVQSVHKGTMGPSARFARVVELLVASMDDLPVFVAETEPITVNARPGSVHQNAIVLGESKKCANPACTIHFVPRVPWQKYCPRCKGRR